MSQKPQREGLLSIILLSYFSSNSLKTTTDLILQKMEAESIPFELIIMDDGSEDDSHFIALDLERRDKRIHAYQLSKNYTTNYSKFAGLSVSNGACAVFVPDDLQRSLDTIVKMYRLWQEGQKIVVDYRTSRDDGFFTDLFARTYYKLMNSFSDVKFPKGGSDGALLDREVIDIINEHIHPTNTSLMVEVLRLGFDPYFLATERPKTEGKSRWTFKKKMRLAMDTFFNSSSFPIKMISMLGMFTFLFSLLLIVLVVFAKLFLNDHIFGFRIPGWTTSIIFITLFNGLNLLGIAIVAEYIWRIYEEVKGRPGYIIKKKQDQNHSE
jgi:dolichol-phosphate mannosyltransferase